MTRLSKFDDLDPDITPRRVFKWTVIGVLAIGALGVVGSYVGMFGSVVTDDVPGFHRAGYDPAGGVTANPGLQGFIVLLNETGQPILYEGVHGKITSGSKRLTDPSRLKAYRSSGGEYTATVSPGPSDEGTYGSSDAYIYYWNQQDQYRQWNGKYLYSDKPIRLRVEPLVITQDDGKKS